MPRRKIAGASAGAANVAPNVGFAQYVGPAGTVRGVLKQLMVQQTAPSEANPQGGEQFRFVVEVKEPEGSKLAAYNGQSAWGRQFLSFDSAGFVNGMLQGLGCSPADVAAFWDGGPNLEKKDAKGNERVLSIGKLKVDPKGLDVVVNMGLSSPGTDKKTGKAFEQKMEPKSFLVPGSPAALPAEVGDDGYEDPDVEEAVTSPVAEEEEEEEGAEETSEVDPFDIRTEELEELDKAGQRPALVKIAKSDHGLTVLKKHTNSDIIDMILDKEFPTDAAAEGPEEEEEAEEAAPPPPAAKAAAPAKTRGRTRSAATVPAANDDDEPPF